MGRSRNRTAPAAAGRSASRKGAAKAEPVAAPQAGSASAPRPATAPAPIAPTPVAPHPVVPRPPAPRTLSELRARALDLHRAGDLDQAAAAYRLLLRQRPRDAGAWTNLGALLRKRGEHLAASVCQRRAHALAPEDAAILNNLGNALQDSDQLDEALVVRREVLRRRPALAESHAMVAVTLRSLGRMEEALAAAEQGLALHPDDGELRVQRAMALLALGDYPRGFAAFEARWEIGEIAKGQDPEPEWRGGDLAGRRILVLPEQGFGDTILMSRFLPALKARGAHVTLAVKPPLRRLFEGVAGADEMATIGERRPRADCVAYMMDLPRLLGCDRAALPPSPALNVPADSRARARALLAPFDGMFRVGVCWSGSVTYKANFKRSFDAERFLPLAAVPGVQLVSLYKGPLLDAFRASGAAAAILDAAGDERDFADAAATILELDLVVTMDTAVAHLAGALGKPVWNLLAFSPFWLYGHEGETTPWHPSMRLLRQARPGDWDGLLARVAAALAARVAGAGETGTERDGERIGQGGETAP